jgi:hypothetical protein
VIARDVDALANSITFPAEAMWMVARSYRKDVARIGPTATKVVQRKARSIARSGAKKVAEIQRSLKKSALGKATRRAWGGLRDRLGL